jgi:hypothetical protein
MVWKVLLYLLIHPLSLPVCLGVVGGREVAGYSDKFVQVLHELSGKLQSSIADDLSGETVFAPDLILIDLSHPHSGEFHVSGDHNDHL